MLKTIAIAVWSAAILVAIGATIYAKMEKARRVVVVPIRTIRDFWLAIRRENITRVIWFTLTIMAIGMFGVFFFERSNPNRNIQTIGDAAWWVIVTIATVGYGDKYPNTLGGRLVAVMIIFIGVGLLSVITATISSILVERKMKEGKGLEDIKLRNHIIICGWNFVAGKILEGLALASKSGHSPLGKIDIVLVNDLEEDKANEIIYDYSGLNIKFVKGSLTSEAVLRRANIGRANSVIILADTTGGRTADQADERTVIGAFAVKNLAPNVKTYAEIYNPENSQHLKRAGVNETIISGEYSGFLLASAALSPGIPKVIKELLAFSTGSDLLSLDIPRRFVGKTFKELSDHFRAEHKAILVAIMSEKKSMVLDDILAGDASSAIDVFIKRKFEESGEDYFAAREGEVEVNLNPGDDYKINEGEQAIIITKRKTAT